MGMIVFVYRDSGTILGDCTAGGISATANKLCVVNVAGPFEPSDDMPAAVLVASRPFGNHSNPVLKPADSNGNATKDWCMFGGNYAATSDSRFSEAVRDITGCHSHFAVPIHDRIEG